MAVKVKKIRGSWYLVIDHKGQRATRKVGGTLAFARNCAKQIQAKLTLNDLSIFAGDEEDASPFFEDYAKRWLEKHVAIKSKPATLRLYSWLMEQRIKPHFSKMRMSAITAEQVEDFVYKLASHNSSREVDAKSTIHVTLAALRSFFTYAKKHKIVTVNPASCLGYAVQSEQEEREVVSMTSEEVGKFLASVLEVCPDQYPMFLTAIRTGMRRGEFLGLRWSDCIFGRDEKDASRYFTVNRTLSDFGYGRPKTKKSKRHVDMSSQLRLVLLELRDKQLLKAMQLGVDDISEQPVFCDAKGKPFLPNNISARFMKPICKAAGIRRFKPHDMRHTFAVLMIQAGAPLQYVSQQLGHSSIKITADVYGKLQPSVLVAQMDMLDLATRTNANGAQTEKVVTISEYDNVIDITALRGKLVGSPLLNECYKTITQTKEFTGAPWEIHGQIETNTQTERKRKPLN